MAQVERWYSNLDSLGKLKFAALSALYGEEKVAAALTEIPDIDSLFEQVAERVYGVN